MKYHYLNEVKELIDERRQHDKLTDSTENQGARFYITKSILKIPLVFISRHEPTHKYMHCLNTQIN